MTEFADGKRLPLLTIFPGEGLGINAVGKKWERRVKVVFQSKAWCDENIMKSWVSEDLANHFVNPVTPGSPREILFADIHRAQQNIGVK